MCVNGSVDGMMCSAEEGGLEIVQDPDVTDPGLCEPETGNKVAQDGVSDTFLGLITI
jgi:hypothetical protein